MRKRTQQGEDEGERERVRKRDQKTSSKVGVETEKERGVERIGTSENFGSIPVLRTWKKEFESERDGQKKSKEAIEEAR